LNQKKKMDNTEEASINKKLHTKFLMHMLNVLPTPYASQDCNKLTLMYFVVSSLDLLGALPEEDKKRIIDYIYSMQVLPDKNDKNKYIENCGFRGGSFFGRPYNPECVGCEAMLHDKSHIAMTYTALAILAICGDDYSKVERKAITEALKHLQQDDGSFAPVPGGENDMRFIFCASVISYILDDWSGIDIEKTIGYILKSQSYDSAIGQGPCQESHGGSTYCAIASLKLMNQLHRLPRQNELIQWCVERQISGFQGRINKPADSCYSFWIGGTLDMLNSYQLVDYAIVKGFTMTCESKYGGFGKSPNTYPDVLHTYMSFCGMSLGGEAGIATIDPMLGFNKKHAERIRKMKKL